MTSASCAASSRRQRFFLDQPVAVARDRGEEVLGLLVAHGAQARAAAVRAGADPGIIAVAPVSEVVAALGAGAGVVGDFVGGQAGGGGALLGQFEQARRGVGVERLEVALGDHRGEARAGLDRQLVEREMLGAERQRAVERRPTSALRRRREARR